MTKYNHFLKKKKKKKKAIMLLLVEEKGKMKLGIQQKMELLKLKVNLSKKQTHFLNENSLF